MADKLIVNPLGQGPNVTDNYGNFATSKGDIACPKENLVITASQVRDNAFMQKVLDGFETLAPSNPRAHINQPAELSLGDLQSPLKVICEKAGKDVTSLR